jgi:hypothetical protein
MSMEGVAKRWPVVLPAPLGQTLSNIQGHCHLSTARSSCGTAQESYGELNYIDSIGFPYRVLVSSRSFWDKFHVNNASKNCSSITLPFNLSVAVSSFFVIMVIPRWPMSLQLRIIHKTPCFVSWYDPIENRPIFVTTIDQVTTSAHEILTLVLRQDAWNTAG